MALYDKKKKNLEVNELSFPFLILMNETSQTHRDQQALLLRSMFRFYTYITHTHSLSDIRSHCKLVKELKLKARSLQSPSYMGSLPPRQETKVTIKCAENTQYFFFTASVKTYNYIFM